MSDKVGPCHHGKIGDEKKCVFGDFRRLGLRDRDEGECDQTGKNTKYGTTVA